MANEVYTKLPCRIGDKVWAIRNYKGIARATEGIVSEMFYTDTMELCIVVKSVVRGKWGVKIFATREACERAIKGSTK